MPTQADRSAAMPCGARVDRAETSQILRVVSLVVGMIQVRAVDPCVDVECRHVQLDGDPEVPFGVLVGDRPAALKHDLALQVEVLLVKKYGL